MSKAFEIVNNGMSLAGFFRRCREGPVCPHCASANVATVASRKPMPYRCRGCRKHFSAMSHTVMHGSKLGAQTWLLALFLILANPKGRSSVQLAADLGITQKRSRPTMPPSRLRLSAARGTIHVIPVALPRNPCAA